MVGMISERLRALSDEGYRAFQCRLMPSVDPARVLGVRQPKIRALAKELTKSGGYESFLRELPHTYYEEDNLHAALIERLPFDEKLTELERFLPYVDNWASCDMIRTSDLGALRNELYPRLLAWLKSPHVYVVRFAVRCLMNEYLGDGFQPEHLALIASIDREEYYIKMMLAWYFATAFAKQFDATCHAFESGIISPWVYGKSIQKACESHRLTVEQKERLREMRRAKTAGVKAVE